MKAQVSGFSSILTARKRSFGQGYVFTPVYQSFCSQWPPKRALRIQLECILVASFVYLTIDIAMVDGIRTKMRENSGRLEITDW